MGDTKLERLSEALRFAASSLVEVRAALGDVGSVKDVYDQGIAELRNRLSEQEDSIVELRRENSEKDAKIARLEAEAATLRRAKANLDKEVGRA